MTRHFFIIAAIMLSSISGDSCATITVVINGQKDACGFVGYQLNPWSGMGRLNFGEHAHLIPSSKARIVEVYRRLGTVPEEEIQEFLKEDDNFFLGTVLYLINEQPNPEESEIIRIVNNSGAPTLYVSKAPSSGFTPVGLKYSKLGIDAKYPGAIELGRLVPAQEGNRLRSFIDTVISAFEYIFSAKHFQENPIPILGESANDNNTSLFGKIGLVEDNEIKLPNGRRLMARNSNELYALYFGDLIRHIHSGIEKTNINQPAAIAQYFKEFDEIAGRIHPQILSRFGFVYYMRAVSHLSFRQFDKLRVAASELMKLSPNNPEAKLVFLHSELLNHFDFYKLSGNGEEALKRIDELEATHQFDKSELPNYLGPFPLDFYRGIILLGMGRYAEARVLRMKIKDATPIAQLLGGTGPLQGTAMVKSIGHLEIIINDRILGSNPQRVQFEKALEKIEVATAADPLGLDPLLYELKAKVLRGLGRGAEANRALQMARGLR